MHPQRLLPSSAYLRVILMTQHQVNIHIQQHRHNTSNNFTIAHDHYSSTDMQVTNHPYPTNQASTYTI
jgi:hypothetical protein